MDMDIFAKFTLEDRLDLRVGFAKESTATGENVGFHADSGEERCHLAPDESASDDEDAFWDRAFQRKKIVTRPYREMGERWGDRPGTCRNNDDFGTHRGSSGLNRFVGGEVSGSAQKIHSGICETGLIVRIDSGGPRVDALEGAGSVDPPELGINEMPVRMAHVTGRLGEADEQLGGDAATIGADPAKFVGLDQCDFFTGFGSGDGEDGGPTAADNDEIVSVHI